MNKRFSASAPEDKSSISKAKQQENEADFRKFITFVLFFVFLLGCVIVFIGIPEMKEKKAQRELEFQASVQGPKVLEELLGEIRLLRIAVEKLGR